MVTLLDPADSQLAECCTFTNALVRETWSRVGTTGLKYLQRSKRGTGTHSIDIGTYEKEYLFKDRGIDLVLL